MNNVIWKEDKLLVVISKVIALKVILLLDRIILPFRFYFLEKSKFILLSKWFEIAKTTDISYSYL